MISLETWALYHMYKPSVNRELASTEADHQKCTVLERSLFGHRRKTAADWLIDWLAASAYATTPGLAYHWPHWSWASLFLAVSLSLGFMLTDSKLVSWQIHSLPVCCILEEGSIDFLFPNNIILHSNGQMK